MLAHNETITESCDCHASALPTDPFSKANRNVAEAVSLTLPAAELTTPSGIRVDSDLVARLLTVALMKASPDATGMLVGRR